MRSLTLRETRRRIPGIWVGCPAAATPIWEGVAALSASAARMRVLGWGRVHASGRPGHGNAGYGQT